MYTIFFSTQEVSGVKAVVCIQHICSMNSKIMENENIFQSFRAFDFISKIIISKCKNQATKQDYIHGSVLSIYDTKTMFYS